METFKNSSIVLRGIDYLSTSLWSEKELKYHTKIHLSGQTFLVCSSKHFHPLSISLFTLSLSVCQWVCDLVDQNGSVWLLSTGKFKWNKLKSLTKRNYIRFLLYTIQFDINPRTFKWRFVVKKIFWKGQKGFSCQFFVVT